MGTPTELIVFFDDDGFTEDSASPMPCSGVGRLENGQRFPAVAGRSSAVC